jgi:hypothetical protein
MAARFCGSCGNERLSTSHQYCSSCGRKFTEQLPEVPSANRLHRSRAQIVTAILASILFAGSLFWLLREFLPNHNPAPEQANNPTTASDQPVSLQLQLISWNCAVEGGWVFVRGEVKNVSKASIADLEAVATLRADKTFVKSELGFVQYDPLLAGQTSPFQLLTPDNPAIDLAQISFQADGGGTIDYTGTRQADCAR